MNTGTNTSIVALFSLVSMGFLMLISGCGKHETGGSVMGTATGAIIGASVAGKNSTGAGALIGGLIGNVIGGGIGRAADEEERQEEQERKDRLVARREAVRQHELERVRQENRVLKQKWCSDCGRETNLIGASSCPSCGGDLIYERYCRECTTTFSPRTGYKFCPYCKHKTRLCAR